METIEEFNDELFTLQEPAQVDFTGLVQRAEETAANIADKITTIPSELRQAGDDVEKAILDGIQRLKRDSTKTIKGNLIQSRAEGIGTRLGRWVANNMILAGGITLAIMWLIFRR